MGIPEEKLFKHLGLPKLGQLGFAVRSIETSLPKYAAFYNVRTWFKPRYNTTQFQIEGQDFPLELDLVVGYLHGLQVELIVGHSSGTNLYGDHIERYGEGLHHLGFYTSKYSQQAGLLSSSGFTEKMTGNFTTAGGGAVSFGYYDTIEASGLMTELIDVTLYGLRLPQTEFLMNIAALTGDVEKISMS